MSRCVVGPSILAADFAQLLRDCQRIISVGATSLHVDIMDGYCQPQLRHFVPNLTIGPPVVAALRQHLPHIHLDCHLMVTHPAQYLVPLAKARVNCFTFHYESSYDGDLKQMCLSIRQHKMEVGVAIKPSTSVPDSLQRAIEEGLVDKVLVMTVEPGFGGQKFMEDMMAKVKFLRAKFPKLDLQVDGGIGEGNAELVGQSGANCIVAGSAIFGANNWQQSFNTILKAALRGLRV